MNINLSKEGLREEVKINLSKQGFNTDDLSAKVCFALDESGSMQTFYNNGSVQAILDKLLAVSYYFDDDGDIDMFAFSQQGRQLPSASQDDHGSYSFRPNYGGTQYADVIGQIEDYYYKATGKKFLGLFGKGATAAEGRNGTEDKEPVYLFFLTDGETFDRAGDTRVLNKLLSDHPDLFIQFVGVGRDSFNVVRDVADNNVNASFVGISDLASEGDDLLAKIITPQVRDILQK